MIPISYQKSCDRNTCFSISRKEYHCVKSVRIRSFSGPYLPAVGLNMKYLCVFNPNSGKYRSEYGHLLDSVYHDHNVYTTPFQNIIKIKRFSQTLFRVNYKKKRPRPRKFDEYKAALKTSRFNH